MAKKLTYLSKSFPALKMVMEPAKQYRDNKGNPVKEPGKYIQFMDGKFETDDPEKQKFIEKYMEEHQGEIVVIDPAEIEKQNRILAKAKQLVEEEDRKKGTDAHGKDLDKKDNIPGNYQPENESEVDKKVADAVKKVKDKAAKEIYKLQKKIEDIQGKASKEVDKKKDEIEKREAAKLEKNKEAIARLDRNQITKKELLELADEFDIELTEAEQKDFQLCRSKVAQRISDQQQKSIQEPEEVPNLDDESEEEETED